MSNTVVGSWDLTVNKTRFLSFWNLYSDGRRWNVQNKRVYSLSNGDVCCGKKSSRIKEIRISLMSLCIHICVDSCACVCVCVYVGGRLLFHLGGQIGRVIIREEDPNKY